MFGYLIKELKRKGCIGIKLILLLKNGSNPIIQYLDRIKSRDSTRSLFMHRAVFQSGRKCSEEKLAKPEVVEYNNGTLIS